MCKHESVENTYVLHIQVKVKKVYSRVSEKAVNTQEPPRQIIADEIQPLSQEVILQLSSNKNLAVIINKKRKQVHCISVAPNSRNDFAIPEEYARIPGGKNFLLHDLSGTGMMVDLLLCYDHLFAHETFSVSQTYFTCFLPCMYW